MDNIIFKTIIDEDSTKIKIFSNNIYVGFVLFEKILDLSTLLFPEDIKDILKQSPKIEEKFLYSNCIYLSNLEVFEEFQGNGYANLLMEKFDTYFDKQNFSNKCMLRASPYNISTKPNKKLPLFELKKFYKNFGFKEILTEKNFSIMLLEKQHI